VLDPLYSLIGWLLAVYYRFIPSLGVAIILLTCTVMLALFPLTAKQARSMIRMQQVQPEIKKIQQKHKDDKQKANEEILRFYQENKINPLSGCLPLLAQMPVFIALFHVLRSGLDTDDPNYIPTSGAFDRLYNDLIAGASSATQFLGMDLDTSPLKASGGFLSTLPYFIVVALIVLTGWYQSRQTMARAKGSGQAANTQMQVITKVMPVLFGVFSLNFPAGLNVYFLTSNAWRVGQQQLVLNKIYEQERSKANGASVVEVPSRDVTDAPEEPVRKAANPNTSRKKKQRRKR
jgi:YidC/Oxa1 family membrane protein insertase